MTQPAQPNLFEVEVQPDKIKAISPKQREVIKFLVDHDTITLDQAVTLIGTQYTNQRFYVGLILSNMAKRGLLVKVKRAVYSLP
jgi:hypothetical protein